MALRPEDVPEGAEFDLIWSNPPIRIGKPALHALLERWLPRLAPGGEAWLVVQKNLGADSLLPWIGRMLEARARPVHRGAGEQRQGLPDPAGGAGALRRRFPNDSGPWPAVSRTTAVRR